MSALKLQSSDGEIIDVDPETVSQILTIQTMIDDLEDDNDEEVIPVPTVDSKVLQKIIHWCKKPKQNREAWIKWQNEYFEHENLENLWRIILAADYLDVKSLLQESCRTVVTSINDEDIVEEADSRVSAILDYYDRNYGYDVIVTVFDDKDVKYYDPKSKSWIQITEIPDQFCRTGLKLSSVKGKLYLVGGQYGDLTEYNPRSDSWREVAKLGRFVNHDVCTLDNQMFVVRGGGNDRTLVFQLDDDDLKEVTHTYTSTSHVDHIAVAISPKLYVIGGSYARTVDRSNYNVFAPADIDITSVVESYNPKLGKWGGWARVADLPTPRLKAAGAVLDNKIYVSGGVFQVEVLQSVFCYDPASNIWTEVASMIKKRRGHSLISLGGLLYAVGGGNDDDGYLDTMEVYDPEKNIWEMVEEKLNGIVDSTGSCVMKRYYFD